MIHRWIKRVFHFHKWTHHAVNIQSEGSTKIVTLAFKECPICGKSKINFIYGNGA